MASVRAEANPDLPPPRLENLRHNLKSNPNLAYAVARLDGDPLGCGCVETSAIPIAQGDVVVPRARRRGFTAWRAQEIDRPTRRPDLSFLALARGEVVGYAVLDDFGADAFHGFTAVKREWRRRRIATALKRSLGYRPEPSLSVVVLRGPPL
jgi:hypothetical protein